MVNKKQTAVIECVCLKMKLHLVINIMMIYFGLQTKFESYFLQVTFFQGFFHFVYSTTEGGQEKGGG